jgi:hypothetical protein
MVQTPSNRLKQHWPQSDVDDASSDQGEATNYTVSKDWTARLAHYLGQHPRVTLAAGAIAGVALGWIVKRK